MENQSSILDMEKAINTLSGIISSKFICEENGQIEELHIVSYNDRGPKQVSRDVQSLLIANYDLKMD
ncbi:MAG: hypothetical protein H7X94_01425, partial [Vallitaleaceae bacterium]|nr:hypothetical protein [Vallitaleaceae bacterium]